MRRAQALTIRSHLVTLVVVALVPILAFAVIVVLRLNRHEKAELQRTTAESAHVLMAAVDRELARSLTSLDVLAFSRQLDHGNLHAFYDDAITLLRAHPEWTTISLASPQGEPLLDAALSFGARPLPPPDPGNVRAAAESRQLQVGSVRIGERTGRFVFPVRVPVIRNGTATAVLTAVITTAAMQRLLEEHRLPGDWIGAIIDADGHVVARTHAAQGAVGQAAGALMPPTLAPSSGWLEGTAVDGSRSYIAYLRSPFSGWTVSLAVPVALVDVPLRRSLWSIAGAGLLFTLVGALAALLVGRRIARSLRALSSAAESLGRGESPLVPQTPVVEVDHVGGAFAAAAAQRAKAEDELRESQARSRRMADEAEARRREADVIAQLARTINASLDFDTVLQAVADAAQQLLACDVARIALWDDTGEAMVYRYTVGTRYTDYPNVRLYPGKGLVGSVITTGEPARADDVFDDPRSNPEYFVLARADGIVSGMAVPIRVRSHVEGVIYFAYRTRRPFTDQDELIAMRLADHAAVALQNAELYRREQRARAEAETANRSKDEFLALLSHELRTPLQSMVGWVRLLRRGALDRAATARALETIDRNAQAQARIIGDLLDISRIVAGKLRIDLRPLNLVAVIGTAVESARPEAAARGILLATVLDRDPVEVEGDPERLQQVLANLLSNALKFTPSGGSVQVRLEREGDRARIAVRDTGPGISADLLPYVFDRFRQADSSATRAHGGLGLGLAIVRHLVELHHGTVRAESGGPTPGATLIVELPLSRGARAAERRWAASGETAGADRPSLAGLSVVVVDDDADTRLMLTVALREHGAEVRAVPSVAEAIVALAETPADVLISDISMPDEDGYSLIRTLRARGQGLPALALTALARVEDTERALAAGFQRCLAKPVDPAELAAIVRVLVAAYAPPR